MQDIVPANNLRVRIGKQWKGVPKLLRVPLVSLRWIHTDADNTNAARVEFRKTVLETPQLGVAEGSPKTAIKDQHRPLGIGKQIAESDRFPILIQQEKVRRFLPNMRCAS